MAYEYEDLFKQSSIPKNLILEFDNGEIFENERIYSESMELTESICTTEELTFGSVNANCFKVTLADTINSHKGLWFNVYLVLNNNTATKYQLGRYYITEDKAQADHSKRNITAYDYLYQIVNTDVASWYNALTFPMTLKTFRTSFCAFVGVSEVDAVLINDSMSIEKTIDAEELSGSDVLSSYCELCGVFPNINREGKLEYITLPKPSDMDEIYPSNDLYPANNLYPRDSKAEHVYRTRYQTCTYDEFITNSISKLQIRQEEGDVGAISGTGDNCYIIEDNFLVYGKGATELNTIADNLYNLISNYTTYRPYSVKTIGNPCVSLGQGVRVSTTYEIVVSVILSRTLKGIQSLRDTYTAKGVESYSEIVNDVRTSIVQLKSKTNKLTRTVDETISELSDFETNTNSKFTQTSESITAEVTRASNAENSLSASITVNADAIKTKVAIGDVSSEISQESDKITITGNRFILSATNCSISEDGTISATNCNLSGTITANAGTIGGFTLSSDGFQYGKTKIYDTDNEGIFVGKTGIEIGGKYGGSWSESCMTLDCESGSLKLNNHYSWKNNPALTINVTSASTKSIQLRNIHNTGQGYTDIYNDQIYIYASSNNYANMGTAGIAFYANGSQKSLLNTSQLIAPSATINGSISASGSISSSDDISTSGSVRATKDVIANLGICSKNGVYYYNGSSFYQRISYDSNGITLGMSGNKVGFFGSSGHTKESVSELSTSETLVNCIKRLNGLIGVLNDYNLV